MGDPRTLPVLEAEQLPSLYARWMEEALPGPIPRETNATCETCAMAAEGLENGQSWFRPDVKCCSYLPELPNFTVGFVLSDPQRASAHGRRSIEERIARGVAVSPLGLAQTPIYALLYDAGIGGPSPVFGRSRQLRCPHFDEENNGSCGIWASRNAVCTTYFCKHLRGKVGQVFWNDVKDLLHAAERAVSLWCAVEIGIDADAIRLLIRSAQRNDVRSDGRVGRELTDGFDAESLRAWGLWVGRERDFYVECARRVEALSWSNVLEIGGTYLRARASVALSSYQNLRTTRLPDRLYGVRATAQRINAQTAVVQTHSPSDTIVLPVEVLNLLHAFDGRPTSVVVADIAQTHGTELGEDLVQRLVDFDILREST